MSLKNSNMDLLTGIVTCLREEVDGWSVVPSDELDGASSDVPNVWTRYVPTGAEDYFPRAVVDTVSGTDTELSIGEDDVKLRESVVRIVIFGENGSNTESLWDDADEALPKRADDYVGDWSYRETDGFAQLSEDEGTESNLRYNRPLDLIFETIKIE